MRFVRGKVSLAKLGQILTDSILIAMSGKVHILLGDIKDQLRAGEVKANRARICCLVNCSCLLYSNYLLDC